MGLTKVQVAEKVLQGIGAPVDHNTLAGMVGWFNAEGGHWANAAKYNPLNTTEPMPGAVTLTNTAEGHIQSYRNWDQGITATVKTLRNGLYGGILQAFKNSNPAGVAQAIGSSDWGTSGAGAAAAIQAVAGQNFHAKSAMAGIARGKAGPQAIGGIEPQSTVIPGSTRTMTTPAKTDTRGALAQALLQESTTPVSSTGNVPREDLLGETQNLISSGQFTTPASTKIITTPTRTLTGARARGTAIVTDAMSRAGAPSGGGLQKVVNLALRAVQIEKKFGAYHYTQAAGGVGDSRTNAGRGPLQGHNNITFDCSGFVEALYRAAGLRDPSGHTHYTGTVESPSQAGALLAPGRLQKVNARQAVPGDIVLFPDHVAVYIGGGRVVSMGQNGDPKIVSVAAEAAYNNRGLTGFYHLRGAD